MTTNNGAGGLVAMRGRCESADFENDTLTFKMDGDYYAAAGEYVITPAALQAPGEAVPCKTVIVYGDHGPEEREPVEDYYTAPPSDVLRRVVEAAEAYLSSYEAEFALREALAAAHKALAEGVERG